MSFPVNVPNVPGVPPVISVPGINDIVSLLTGDAISLFAGAIKAPWGIYFGPIPVIINDTVIQFGFDQRYDISDFPIEGGSFQSYNKVYEPFQATFRFVRGGSLIDRQELLDSISAIIGDINLYNVVTADAVYQNVNLISYSYQQTGQNGIGMLTVDVVARQVKIASSAILSSVQDPGSASQVNDGTLQPAAASQTQQSFLPSIVGGF